MRIVFLILATALSVSAQQAGTTTPSPTKSAMNDSLEQEILAKEKEVWDISIRGDLKAYSRLMTDDLLVVYSTGYESKADELKDFGPMEEGHYSMTDVRIIPLGDAAGLVVYRVAQDWREGGKKLARDYYVSSLWQRQEGDWVNRFWQETDTGPLNIKTLSPADAKQQVLDLEQQWLTSQQTNNVDLLEPLLADGFISTSSEGKVSNRAQTIADQKATKYTSADYTDVKVMLFGDTGIAIGNFRSKGTSASGKPLDANERFTDTWVKMPSGKWQCVASHESPLKM